MRARRRPGAAARSKMLRSVCGSSGSREAAAAPTEEQHAQGTGRASWSRSLESKPGVCSQPNNLLLMRTTWTRAAAFMTFMKLSLYERSENIQKCTHFYKIGDSFI